MLENQSVLSTGSLYLDSTLKVGGIPRGQIVEISGSDSSGKTTLCLSILAEASRAGENCAFFDTDLGLTPVYAQACGVDLNHLHLAQLTSADAVLDMMDRLARCGGIQVMVLDSASSLTQQNHATFPQTDVEQAENEQQLARWLSRLAPVLQKNQTILLITTHEYAKRSGSVYHNLANNTARLALKLHAGIRLRLSSSAFLKHNQQVNGERIEIRVLKNRFAPCSPSLKLDIMYNDGILKHGELLELGVQLAVIRCKAGCYTYRDQVIGDGYAQSLLFLKNSAFISQEIYQEIRRKLFPAASFIFPLYAAKA